MTEAINIFEYYINELVQERQTEKRLHNIWSGMLNRCYGRHRSHESYRKNGIQVCAIWRQSFEQFKRWALANGYRDDLQIDRIRPLGNYEPDNCRWVTAKENCRNRVHRSFITIDGETMQVCEAAEKFNLSPTLVYRRCGQSVKLQDLLNARKCGRRMVTIRGETLCAKQMAEKYHIPYPTFIYRLNYGYEGEDLIADELR